VTPTHPAPGSPTPTTTLHVWRIPRRALPRALWRMASDPRRLRREPGTRFVKLLGTGRGADFGAGAGDLTRWAAVTVTDGPPPPFPGWARIAEASCRIALRPLITRGTWAGVEPFEATGSSDARWDGPVLALTRARLRPSRAPAFWRAIGPAARPLADTPGLVAAFGIGEAPLGWQGTVSLWRSTADLTGFAYRDPGHRRVIARTPIVGWYAEELFTRFAVLDVTGDPAVIGATIDGTGSAGLPMGRGDDAAGGLGAG